MPLADTQLKFNDFLDGQDAIHNVQSYKDEIKLGETLDEVF